MHPTAVGRRIEVTADLERVRVFCEGRLVADHARCWAKQQTITDPVHAQAAKRLRHDRLAVVHPPAQTPVEQRVLADYDAAFGLDGLDDGLEEEGAS